jgi:hypothetical protein
VILSHKHRFIFLKTRKTASTSVEVWLERSCGPDDVVTPIHPAYPGHEPRNHRAWFSPVRELAGFRHDWESRLRSLRRTAGDLLRRRRFYNHIRAELARCRISRDVWRSYMKWCVERHPIEKVRSHYWMMNSRREARLSPAEYLEQHELPVNWPIYCSRDGGILVDRIVRYDELESGLRDVAGDLGLSFDGLDVHAKGGNRPAHDHDPQVFSGHQRRIIRASFAREEEILRAAGIVWTDERP